MTAQLKAALAPTSGLEARPLAGAGRGLTGRIRVPGDKSISHRALILGAMASGATEIDGLLTGDDVLATLEAVRTLGAAVEQTDENRWRVEGRGRFTQAAGEIDCGNSGTGARLLIGAAAGYNIATRFTGDASLRRRPMQRVITPLTEMGARFETADGGRLPLTVSAPELRAIEHWQETASAQVKSAVLLAALNAHGQTTVYESAPSRDHTERMLVAFGARVKVVDLDHTQAIRLPGRQKLKGAQIVVPGDPSSAAFPLVAALLVPGSEVTVEGMLLNPLRTGLFETLWEMGADLTVENERDSGGEPIGDVTARASALRGVVVPEDRAPSMIDEYPILAAAAAYAEGDTVMRGLSELRVKESDRIALMAAGLLACGVDVEEEPEGLIIHGAGLPPRGGVEVATEGDHRVAMSHLVLGLAAERPVRVDAAEMIATSFPGFASLMNSLGADLAET